MKNSVSRLTWRKSVAVVAALAATAFGAAGASASFEPRFEFHCGSAGTFYSEVLALPADAAPTVAPPDAAAGLPGYALARLLTTTGGETNQVFVLLAVLGTFTTPGLVANQSNPNLVTCIITRPNGSQFEAVGLLTPAA